MLYGTPKDPIIEKLEKLENRLKNIELTHHHLSNDLDYYWTIKNNYPINTWLVIKNQTVLFDSDKKSDCLNFIANQEQNDQSNTHLLIQINQENNSFEI